MAEVTPPKWTIQELAVNGPLLQGKNSAPEKFHEVFFEEAQKTVDQIGPTKTGVVAAPKGFRQSKVNTWVEVMPADEKSYFVKGYTKFSAEHDSFSIFNYTDETVGPPFKERSYQIPPWGSKTKEETLEIWTKSFPDMLKYQMDLLESCEVIEQVGDTITAKFLLKSMPGVGKQSFMTTCKISTHGENKDVLSVSWVSTDHPDAKGKYPVKGYVDTPCLGGIMVCDTAQNIWYQLQICVLGKIPAPILCCLGGQKGADKQIMKMIQQNNADACVKHHEFVNEGKRGAAKGQSAITRQSVGGMGISPAIPANEAPVGAE